MDMKGQRQIHLAKGLQELSNMLSLQNENGRNGERISTDEAEVWKRVLSYRICKYALPKNILETHPGLGIGTSIYKIAHPHSIICDTKTLTTKADLVDIDPFGRPWSTISKFREVVTNAKIVFVTSGEIQTIVRRLTKAQTWPTKYYGRTTPKWVESEYIPRMESELRMQCNFFFAYPTMVRAVFSKRQLPQKLFEGCPKWMWWFSKYA